MNFDTLLMLFILFILGPVAKGLLEARKSRRQWEERKRQVPDLTEPPAFKGMEHAPRPLKSEFRKSRAGNAGRPENFTSDGMPAPAGIIEKSPEDMPPDVALQEQGVYGEGGAFGLKDGEILRKETFTPECFLKKENLLLGFALMEILGPPRAVSMARSLGEKN
ncbi:hypothetical protein [Thermoanaerobacterium sp. DL9XJH110]|uniref:hypothetical protein n=1 Tax=Thermoanaerobacterium sp. DL9XJH110 TaxID=3386643 RepID=UPI003BB6DD2F